MTEKHPLLSKTIIVGLIQIGISFSPDAKAWVSANPDAYASGIGILIIALRYITEKPIKRKLTKS